MHIGGNQINVTSGYGTNPQYRYTTYWWAVLEMLMLLQKQTYVLYNGLLLGINNFRVGTKTVVLVCQKYTSTSSASANTTLSYGYTFNKVCSIVSGVKITDISISTNNNISNGGCAIQSCVLQSYGLSSLVIRRHGDSGCIQFYMILGY